VFFPISRVVEENARKWPQALCVLMAAEEAFRQIATNYWVSAATTSRFRCCMNFTRIDLLPSYDAKERNQAQTRWEGDGRADARLQFRGYGGWRQTDADLERRRNGDLYQDSVIRTRRPSRAFRWT
jgi:hypothetical protein